MAGTSYSFLCILCILCVTDADEFVSKQEFQSLQNELNGLMNMVKDLKEENRQTKMAMVQLEESNQRLTLTINNLESVVEDLKSQNSHLMEVSNDPNDLKHSDSLLASGKKRELMQSAEMRITVIEGNDNKYEEEGGENGNWNKDDGNHSSRILDEAGKEKSETFTRSLTSNCIPTTDTQAMAFSAYITPNFDLHIGGHHVFVYDAVLCNAGNAYNKNTGIFTAPVSGLYAFLWTVAPEGSKGSDGRYGEIGTELMVNSDSKALNHADTESKDEDAKATGFVIVHINENDVVYIRTLDGQLQQQGQ